MFATDIDSLAENSSSIQQTNLPHPNYILLINNCKRIPTRWLVHINISTAAMQEGPLISREL